MYEEEIHLKKLLLKQLDMVLEHLTLVTLTFDPVTPKLIWFICYPGLMCGPSLRKVSQGVLELLIGNEKVTGGQRPTDRQTCAKPSLLQKGAYKSKPITL